MLDSGEPFDLFLGSQERLYGLKCAQPIMTLVSLLHFFSKQF